MGKYMKKSKVVRGDIAVVEGVRTRAKTLALQRLNLDVVDESSLCYLQLRSRRLEKSPTPSKLKQQPREKTSHRTRDNGKQNPNPNQKKGSVSLKETENATSNEVYLEAFYGDNILDLEHRDRSTRESAPCSLTRACDTIGGGTPGSTSRQTTSTATNRGVWSDVQRIIPTAHEIEEFFASVEKQQQRLFIEKYNFDIVNDLPLPGCYEWVQVAP